MWKGSATRFKRNCWLHGEIMPRVTIRLRYTGAVPGTVNLNQRAWNRVVRDCWMKVGKMWHKHMAQKHFTKAGAREYEYTPRKGEESGVSSKAFWRSYTGRKKKAKGHTLPLVWSGETRSRARTARIEAYATRRKSGVRISLNLPALNRLSRKSNINMREEMTTVSARESQVLIRYLNKLIDRRLKAIRRTATTVIK